MTAFLLVLGAYLLGAVPFGLLIGLIRGVDIRKHGSGNIGATNAGRVLGRKWGYVCLALDILKGLAPTMLAMFLVVREPIDATVMMKWIAVGAAAVLGHTFPIYLAFKGGKGVATTIGVALGIFPYFTVAMAAALLVYGLVRLSTGIVSAGSLALAVVFPLAFFVYVGIDPALSLDVYWPLGAVAIALGLLIIVRHRSNLARLFRGQEPALARSRPAEE